MFSQNDDYGNQQIEDRRKDGADGQRNFLGRKLNRKSFGHFRSSRNNSTITMMIIYKYIIDNDYDKNNYIWYKFNAFPIIICFFSLFLFDSFSLCLYVSLLLVVLSFVHSFLCERVYPARCGPNWIYLHLISS